MCLFLINLSFSLGQIKEYTIHFILTVKVLSWTPIFSCKSFWKKIEYIVSKVKRRMFKLQFLAIFSTISTAVFGGRPDGPAPVDVSFMKTAINEFVTHGARWINLQVQNVCNILYCTRYLILFQMYQLYYWP